MHYTEPYRTAVKLQRLVSTQAAEPSIKPMERSSLVRAYVELEEMKRRIRMKPLPKSIDVSHDGKPIGKRSREVSRQVQGSES